MDYNMDHLERELAGIATRLEQMERDRDDEKRVSARTPGGVFIPKGASLPSPTTEHTMAVVGDLSRRVGRMEARMDNLTALVTRMARVQSSHQAAIEDLSLMSTLVVPE